MENWIIAGASCLTVLATSVLVFITGYYAWETRKARETAKDTLSQLKAEHDFSLQPSVIVQKWRGEAVQIANLGRGPGLNINVRLSFVRDDGSFVFQQGRHPGLAPGENAVLLLQVVPIPEGVSADEYRGPGIAKVELRAQNIVTGKFQEYLDKALRPDWNWQILAPIPE